jgi:exopolysaccharide biosynthesis polyprenyl glycosylphosphotransferase
LYGGIALVVVALSKYHATVHGYDYSESVRLGWSILFIGVLATTAYTVGLPNLDPRRSALLNAALAAGFGLIGISAIQLLAGDALLPRAVVFGSVAILIPFYAFVTRFAEGFRHRDACRDRVLIVGNADELDLAVRDAERAFQPFTMVEPLTVAEATPVTGSDEAFVDRAITSRATVVALSRNAQLDEGILGQAATLHEAGVRIRSLSAFYEEWLGKMPLGELERVSLMFDIAELHGSRYARAKRIVDVLIAGLALPILIFVTPLVAVAGLVGNRGPILFRQVRVGRNGQPFTMFKFRTMRPSAASSSGPSEWTSEDDGRITPFGKLLRRSHLDELPQVWNVLRGDLSVVGPRPEQPQYVDELRKKIPFYDLRHLVRPGLTGWAQLNYPYGSSDEDALEKLQFEFWYLRHQSLGLDVRIVARTAQHVFVGGGR